MSTNSNKTTPSKANIIDVIKTFALKWYGYVTEGVWNDTRSNLLVNVVKTGNLSVRSFLNTDLQMRAGSLTYQTLLALVPALALIFAIGRGFGFQDVLEKQLITSFPAQQEALTNAFQFVDSYLEQSSGGVFVGVGICFLLWTLISLVGNVENAFNLIWGIKHGRTLWRKITDYTAIFLILPILMICSSGIMMFMTTTLKNLLPFGMTPLIKVIVDFISIMLIWLFFAGSYMLVPNTKVKFKNAILAGVVAGSGYALLQWLFVSGQVYVTRYNAIYGSFAFLPLLLIWLQMVWTITLAGAVLCFSSQSIFEFSFSSAAQRISSEYKWKVTLAVMTIAVERFTHERTPMTPHQIAMCYELPIKLVNSAVNKLTDCGLLMHVMVPGDGEELAIVPAVEASKISVGMVLEKLGACGASNFIPSFESGFKSVSNVMNNVREDCIKHSSDTLLINLPIIEITTIKK